MRTKSCDAAIFGVDLGKNVSTLAVSMRRETPFRKQRFGARG